MGYRNIAQPSCRPLAFTLYNAFLKNKKGLGLVSLPYFLHFFFEITDLSCYIQLTDQISLSGCL